jgi:hypothetical protein
MKKVKFQMENDPVATARGSDTTLAHRFYAATQTPQRRLQTSEDQRRIPLRKPKHTGATTD